MNKPLELVRELSKEVEFTELSDRNKKLECIFGREIVRRTLFDHYGKWVNWARYHGFYWFVKSDFALRFKYHASLLEDCVGKWQSGYREVYRYCGDLPDTVLEKVELVKKSGPTPFPYITVHSMEPLPIKIAKIPRQVESIAIWWFESPRFRRTWLGWKTVSNVLGVVIAIWDIDREIEILS